MIRTPLKSYSSNIFLISKGNKNKIKPYLKEWSVDGEALRMQIPKIKQQNHGFPLNKKVHVNDLLYCHIVDWMNFPWNNLEVNSIYFFKCEIY